MTAVFFYQDSGEQAEDEGGRQRVHAAVARPAWHRVRGADFSVVWTMNWSLLTVSQFCDDDTVFEPDFKNLPASILVLGLTIWLLFQSLCSHQFFDAVVWASGRSSGA